MTPHLKYLRYVLLHKLFVLRAGLLLRPWWNLSWLLRLVLHDLSKFRPSEWMPYTAYFYGGPRIANAEPADPAEAAVDRRIKARFQYAWLLHIHRNPHHWQHWLLRQDDGKTITLIPPAWVADEMVADWIGAGGTILAWPSMRQKVGETIVWYTRNREIMVLREPVRALVEQRLFELAVRFELASLAKQVEFAQSVRQTLTVRV